MRHFEHCSRFCKRNQFNDDIFCSQCLHLLSSNLGAPPELVQKLLNDSKAMVCITMDGPFYCFSFKSSIMPMEMGFKVGEEFDFASPFDPTDVQKVD